jgi:hypothetical protein
MRRGVGNILTVRKADAPRTLSIAKGQRVAPTA